VPSHILVIGSASIDLKGHAKREVQRGTSVPGTVTLSYGGVARNVAENLARLGQPSILLSAVGDDTFGEHIIEYTGSAGVDVSRVIVSKECPSGSYLAILDQTGSKVAAVDDMAVIDLVTPAYLRKNHSLFKAAEMVVLDANLSPRTLSTAVRMAKEAGVPLAVDPASAGLAPRVRAYLQDIAVIKPDLAEAEVLCRHPIRGRADATAAVQELVAAGVGIALISLAEEGVCYASARERGYMPAIRCEVVDYTGGGDALTATVVYGLVNHLPLDETVRLAVSAASLTLQCPETVCPDLSLERLYDQLSI
jgi:pseudouridine kinase